MIGNRFVAVVDILGFSNMIDKKKLSDILPILNSLFDFSNEINTSLHFHPKSDSDEKEFFEEFKPFVCQFSDTILFWTKPDEKITIKNRDEIARKGNLFCTVLSNFISASLAYSIPLRAGIAYGETYINIEKSIYVGKAIVKAHQIEMNQQWIGCSIDKTVPFNNYSTGNIVDYNIPFKKNGFDCYAIRWPTDLIATKYLKRAFDFINKGEQDNTKEVYEKYRNTKLFMIEMLKNSFDLEGNNLLHKLKIK